MPFVHGLDRLLGAIFGVLEGAVVVGVCSTLFPDFQSAFLLWTGWPILN